MRNRAFRPIATILSVLLICTVPAQAGTIPLSEVVSVVNNFQGGNQSIDLRLRNLQQQQNGSLSGTGSPSSADGVGDPPPLLASVAMPQEGTQTVQTIEQGEISGTICDCGEITVPGGGGGFPWWPFLALVPIVCVTGACTNNNDCVGPNCIPACTDCNPPEIPEPGTLLLFGTGLTILGAGLRRRYSRVKLEKQIATPTEG